MSRYSVGCQEEGALIKASEHSLVKTLSDHDSEKELFFYFRLTTECGTSSASHVGEIWVFLIHLF